MQNICRKECVNTYVEVACASLESATIIAKKEFAKILRHFRGDNTDDEQEDDDDDEEEEDDDDERDEDEDVKTRIPKLVKFSTQMTKPESLGPIFVGE